MVAIPSAWATWISALSPAEIDTLYNEILQIPISADQARKIHDTTEGWTMGLVLAAHGLAEKSSAAKENKALRKSLMADYFQHEIFTGTLLSS